MKKKTEKSLTNKDQINREIAYLRQFDIAHTYQISNYTTQIETPSKIIRFNDRMLSNRAFAGYSKIKKDLAEYTANEVPTIDKFSLDYFQTYIEGDIFKRQCFLVDIKSAYATILLNDGFISHETFKYINTLPKKDRLACVGMLASHKNVFKFQGKELLETGKIINPLENYFWYCVKRTSEIMNNVRSETNPLFFWVDGIYFKTQSDARRAKEILKAEKYLFSEKKIFYFSAKTKTNNFGDSYNKIQFYEGPQELGFTEINKKELDFKTFAIPVNKAIKNTLINYLLKKQNLQA
jgi:hypothetical protein